LQTYHRLVRNLGPEHPVHGFRAQGLDTDDEPLTRIEDMADSYVAALRGF